MMFQQFIIRIKATGNLFQVASGSPSPYVDLKMDAICQLASWVGEQLTEGDVDVWQVDELYPSSVVPVFAGETKICPLCGKPIGRGERHGVGLCS